MFSTCGEHACLLFDYQGGYAEVPSKSFLPLYIDTEAACISLYIPKTSSYAGWPLVQWALLAGLYIEGFPLPASRLRSTQKESTNTLCILSGTRKDINRGNSNLGKVYAPLITWTWQLPTCYTPSIARLCGPGSSESTKRICQFEQQFFYRVSSY